MRRPVTQMRAPSILSVLAVLLLASGLQAGQPSAPQPSAVPGPVPVGGVVTSVDKAARNIKVSSGRTAKGAVVQTVSVPPSAQIYRVAEAKLADIKAGDIVQFQTRPLSVRTLMAGGPAGKFPPRLLTVTGDVTAIRPLTIQVAKGLTVTASDADVLGLARWRKVDVGEILVGDRATVVAMRTGGGLTAGWVQLWPARAPAPK